MTFISKRDGVVEVIKIRPDFYRVEYRYRAYSSVMFSTLAFLREILCAYEAFPCDYCRNNKEKNP